MPDWLFGLLIFMAGGATITLGVIADKLTRIIKLLEVIANRD